MNETEEENDRAGFSWGYCITLGASFTTSQTIHIHRPQDPGE